MNKKLTYYQEGKILWDWWVKYGQHFLTSRGTR